MFKLDQTCSKWFKQMNLVQTWCPQRSPEIPRDPQRSPKDTQRPQKTPDDPPKTPEDPPGCPWTPRTSREALEMSSKLCLTNRLRSCNGLPLCFSSQNDLDLLLSLYMYFFMPKVLLKDQKMLNLRRIKNDQRGPSDLCANLTHLREQT